LPALEAMACGTPVVVAKRAALPEVVGDGGLLIDPEDSGEIAKAVERVLTDREFRSRLSEKALEQAARFTWRRTAEQTLQVYRSVGER